MVCPLLREPLVQDVIGLPVIAQLEEVADQLDRRGGAVVGVAGIHDTVTQPGDTQCRRGIGGFGPPAQLLGASGAEGRPLDELVDALQGGGVVLFAFGRQQ
jgi:hypothetical protein